MVFPACFSLPTPTPWVFPLTNFSSRPVFPPQQINKLPKWGFQLAFLFLHPHRGFFCSLSSSHAQFSPRNRSISFRSGFSSLLFFFYAHAVGFSAHFLSLRAHFSPRHTPTSFRFVFSRLLFFLKTHDMCFFPYISSHTHTFLPGTHQLASVLCFSACFSS